METMEQMIDALEADPGQQHAMREKIQELEASSFPKAPVNVAVQNGTADNFSNLSLFRRSELCTEEMRASIAAILRQCGIPLDEEQFSELASRLDLQSRLHRCVIGGNEGNVHPHARALADFIRDGIDARLFIERLFTNNIVTLKDVSNTDRPEIIDCFKRHLLQRNLANLEGLATFEEGSYVIKPFTRNAMLIARSSQNPPLAYCLEDNEGTIIDGFYCSKGQWYMDPLNVGS